jgi:hypothetical protein
MASKKKATKNLKKAKKLQPTKTLSVQHRPDGSGGGNVAWKEETEEVAVIAYKHGDRPWGQSETRRKTMASRKVNRKLKKARPLQHSKPLQKKWLPSNWEPTVFRARIRIRA